MTQLQSHPQALDEALERMSTLDFELPNGFVNHGPMACEALAVLGCHDQIEGWARWFTHVVGEGPTAVAPSITSRFDWQDALGDYRRLPEWIGYFEQEAAVGGWQSLAEQWVPRLMPALATALFHGAIRTAHAVRGVSTVDTPPRRTELARALGYWAARFRIGESDAEPRPTGDTARGVVDAAASGARHYLDAPNILRLHGVTGAMAVNLLLDHLSPEDGFDALRQIHAEHLALYGSAPPSSVVSDSATWDEGLGRVAAESQDAHQVKLVEACRRGFAVSNDPVFAAAASRSTGRS